MKWKYDVRHKQWWVKDMHYVIEKTDDGQYKLSLNYCNIIGRFNKLKSAKIVAELLENG